jgi:hypothetical protein
VSTIDPRTSSPNLHMSTMHTSLKIRQIIVRQIESSILDRSSARGINSDK